MHRLLFFSLRIRVPLLSAARIETTVSCLTRVCAFPTNAIVLLPLLHPPGFFSVVIELVLLYMFLLLYFPLSARFFFCHAPFF
jgi:hypothetical protein